MILFLGSHGSFQSAKRSRSVSLVPTEILSDVGEDVDMEDATKQVRILPYF